MNLSNIKFADLDPATIESQIIKSYEKIAKTTLFAGDPVRLFLESIAYVLVVQNQVIDLAGRQNLLAYARDSHLDHIGMMVGTHRHGTAHAKTTLRFSLVQALYFEMIIPQGTRVASADGNAIFVTLENGIIPKGQVHIDCIAESTVQGMLYNGFVAGQISTLIDPIAYVQSVQNITTSISGADIEDDTAYRMRIQLAPESFTCAGPIGSYRFLALDVHADIAEVAIYSSSAGIVDVRPVMKNGELPSEEILEAIRKKLNSDDVRPLTDTVIVKAPELVDFEVEAHWWIDTNRDALVTTTKTAVKNAVDEFILWQRSKPGRDVNPTKLVSLMEQAGAKRVDVISPKHTAIASYALAREVNVNITYMGTEDAE